MNSPLQTVHVDLRVYTMDAVLKSSYRFTGRCFVEIKMRDEHTAEVCIRTKRSEDSVETLVAEFLNDLIDQRLRTIIASETAAIRDLILAHALSKTDFLRPDLETADPLDDPAGISTPDMLKSAPGYVSS